jgi:hypothetical protein
VRDFTAAAGVGASRGGKSSCEISTTEAGEETRTFCRVGVALTESTGARLESLSQPSVSAVSLGAGEGVA